MNAKPVKTARGYTYKGFYISRAKLGSVKGFSCAEIQQQKPLTLKEVIAKLDTKAGA